METLKFKTNIKCGACVATVTPFLENDNAVANWKVDLQSPQRTLEVETSHSAAEITELLKRAGYNAEKVSNN
jgi:copper chaperone